MAFCLLFLYTFLTQDLWAFRLNIVDNELELGEGEVSTTATVVNDSDSMIAIEATVRIREHSLDGVENIDRIADDLLIIPNQMIIPPKGEQVVSIRWTGAKDIPNEKAYRLLVEYISISEDKLKGNAPTNKQAGININYRIAKSFYITPNDAAPIINIEKIENSVVDNDEKLIFVFNNDGNKHQIADAIHTQVKTKSGEKIKVVLSKSHLGGKGMNLLPNEKRQVVIPCPNELKGKSVTQAIVLSIEE